MRKIISLLFILALPTLFSCAKVARPTTVSNEPGKLAEAGRLELQKEPDVIPIDLPTNAFVLTMPPMPQSGTQVSLSFNNQHFEHIIQSLIKTLNVNIIYDSRFNSYKQTEKPTSVNLPGMASQQALPLMPERTDNSTGSSSGSNTTVTNIQTKSTSKTYQYEGGTDNFDYLTINFSGTLSDLFKELAETSGYFFVERNKTIVIKKVETFSVIIPNYQDLLKIIEDNIAALGGTDVAYDNLTSAVSFKSDYRSFKRIKLYLDRMQQNASLVSLRIVLLGVKLTKDHNQGIDWTKFQMGQGALRFNSAANPFDGTADTLLGEVFDKGVAATGVSTGMSLLYQNQNFSISGLVNFIGAYGESNIMQNVFLSTLSGTAGQIEVVTETPYVKSIGVTALSNSTTATSNTVETATVKSGVTMDLTPYYNRSDKTIAMKLKINVSDFLQYVQLNAGSLGTLSQPEIATRLITTSLRMSPSQVAVIGGLKYTKKANGSSGLSFIPRETFLTHTTNENETQEELVVVIKPTVFEFRAATNPATTPPPQ